jgi:dTDP-4-dehydrorhamnose reductase
VADYLLRAGKTVNETSRRPDRVSAKRIFLDLAQDVSDWQQPGEAAVAYLCAGVSALDRCAGEPGATSRVNVDNTVALARRLVDRGVFVVFLSTNLVFDGARPWRNADEAVCPRTEYGRQKAEAERQLLAFGDSVAVVRLTKVLGRSQPLMAGWIEALQRGRVIRPFSDLVLAPVSLSFAIEAVCRIGELRPRGIVQVSGGEDVPYEWVARRIAQRMGECGELVRPLTSREAGVSLEAVPSYTTLDTGRLRRDLGLTPPDVWTVVDSVLCP